MNKSYLWEKLGSIVQKGLKDNGVFEIMLNPDGKLWFKTTAGNRYIGLTDRHAAAAFAHALAQYENKFLNDDTPYLDAVLPFGGERINITLPPVTEHISFNIRKKARRIYTLNDYVRQNIMTQKQAEFLESAVRNRKNILISGSPAAGKTTLANALLETMERVVPEGHRILILEQVPELQCAVENLKTMLTSDKVSMNKLLWIAMRNAPDRIVIGEVRDGAALDMLKAWNTGCPGGIATIHANNAKAAVQRVLDLACEASKTPPFNLAAEALDVIVQIEERASKRVVSGIAVLKGFDSKKREFIFHEDNDYA